MLRVLKLSRRIVTIPRVRAYSNGLTKVTSIAAEFDVDLGTVDSSSVTSSLPFDMRRHSETFGQLVRSDHVDNAEAYSGVRLSYVDSVSQYRNADGSFIKGSNAEEARLDDLTLEGRVDRSVTKLPSEIAKVINNNILRLAVPDKLRERSALIFQSLEKHQIQKAPDSSIDCDAHIASLFLQNYSHARQVLLELQKRVGVDKFNPQHVLDIGYGPATGIVALNEIMGDSWIPVEKEAYVVGRKNHQMKKRAKIILSRQLNENFVPEEVKESEEKTSDPQNDDIKSESAQNEDLKSESVEKKDIESESVQKEDIDEEDVVADSDYIGPIDTSAIKIRTRLRDNLPVTKKYDLIIVNQSLLTREYNFPRDIDVNLHLVLRLLKPGGHVVLIERGNTLGFETIARARQVMIRPESYPEEIGKIPRPYIKGSSIKPQRALRKDDQILTEIDRFESEIIEKYGEPTEEDLRFEFEGDENFELLKVSEGLSPTSVDYHLKVLAPCPHHSKCPLQLGDPKYYKISSHKHRLSFCSFNKVVERPKYTMELKKGRRLATTWDKSTEDGFGLDRISKKQLKSLEGSGRPGGRNTENGSYSYLIAERSKNDTATIERINRDRELNKNSISDITDQWPRVINAPSKIKNNVKLNVCASSGKIETWTIPKSLGKQVYHDARKVDHGDLWPLGKKSVIVKNSLSDEAKEKLEVLAKTQKKAFLKDERKKQLKKKTTNFTEHDIESIADEFASNLEQSKKFKQAGKKMNLDVDIRQYDGK
jgi:ribosomal protein RSM22 (predicted rRNA methylase)